MGILKGSMGFRVYRVWGLGLGVSDLRKVQGLGIRLPGVI